MQGLTSIMGKFLVRKTSKTNGVQKMTIYMVVAAGSQAMRANSMTPSRVSQRSQVVVASSELRSMDTYNLTIFAYELTGSGKLYTMGSGSSVHIPPEDYGIIPRVTSYMFDHIDTKIQENHHYKAELMIRFLEIYGEEIHDLLVTLGDSTGESKVSLRDAKHGKV